MDELNSSELGTHEYWENAYKQEIENFEHFGDVGDVWFGEDSVERVTKWLERAQIPKDTKIIDVGCGNGYSLMELANEGFINLTGIDYSAEAIALAEKIAKEKFPMIKYKMFDILNEDTDILNGPFGVIHDKGTYDAISLHPDDPGAKRKCYIEKICNIMDGHSIFVITSCNWTESELIEHFKDNLILKCSIPTPQFKFGGKVGSVVTSLVFNKKD